MAEQAYLRMNVWRFEVPTESICTAERMLQRCQGGDGASVA